MTAGVETGNGDPAEYQRIYYEKIGMWCILCPADIYCETAGETIWTGQAKLFTKHERPTANQLKSAAGGYYMRNMMFLFGRHIHDCPGCEPKSTHRAFLRVSNPEDSLIIYEKKIS